LLFSSGLAEDSDVALCRWASTLPTFRPSTTAIGWLLSPAICYLHHPLPPPPAQLLFDLLGPKEDGTVILRNVGYFSSQHHIPEDVYLQNVDDACHLAVKS